MKRSLPAWYILNRRISCTWYFQTNRKAGSVEISPNITAELNDKGELIGIEILNASAFLRDSILESVQAKVLQLSGAEAGS